MGCTLQSRKQNFTWSDVLCSTSIKVPIHTRDRIASKRGLIAHACDYNNITIMCQIGLFLATIYSSNQSLLLFPFLTFNPFCTFCNQMANISTIIASLLLVNFLLFWFRLIYISKCFALRLSTRSPRLTFTFVKCKKILIKREYRILVCSRLLFLY